MSHARLCGQAMAQQGLDMTFLLINQMQHLKPRACPLSHIVFVCVCVWVFEFITRSAQLIATCSLVVVCEFKQKKNCLVGLMDLDLIRLV